MEDLRYLFRDELPLCSCCSERERYAVDVHEPVHPDTIMKVTNKMQLYRLIYYS